MDMIDDLVKRIIKLGILIGMSVVIRTVSDDALRWALNESWQRIEETPNLTDAEKIDEFEKDVSSIRFKNALNFIRTQCGDDQERIVGKNPVLSLPPDLIDLIRDKTGQFSNNNQGDWTVTEQQFCYVIEGEIRKIDKMEINFEQDMQGVFYFSRIVRVNSASRANAADMLHKEGDTKDKDICIITIFPYKNFYATRPNKMDTSSQVHVEVTGNEVKVTRTISVFQDSFEVIDSPNGDPEEQFGFRYKDDPRKTYDEFCDAAKMGMKLPSTSSRGDERSVQNYMNQSFEEAKTSDATKKISPNAVSYFLSVDFFEKNRDRFKDQYTTIIEANKSEALKTALTLYCAQIKEETKKKIVESPDYIALNEINKIKNGNDLKVNCDITVRVYQCEYGKQTENTEFKDIHLSEIEFPEDYDSSKIRAIRSNFPYVGGKKVESETLSGAELEELKRSVFSESDAKKVAPGDVCEEEATYTVYGEDVRVFFEQKKQEEQEVQEEQKVGKVDTKKRISLAKSQPKGTYTALRYGNLDDIIRLLEDSKDLDITEEDKSLPNVERDYYVL